MNQTDLIETPSTADERARLEALARCGLLETEPEPRFDDIARLAVLVCQVPMAVVTLVGDRRLWFKARIGINRSDAPRHFGFCSEVINRKELVEVPDALADRRHRDNALVANPPHVRFYAGAPLIDRDGHALGTLAVMDVVPRQLSAAQRAGLQSLAQQVVAQVELRNSLESLQQTVCERDASRERLEASHRDLERRVAERTAALLHAHVSLRTELQRREHDAHVAQAIIDSLPGIFYVFDQTGRFLRWNQNFERVTESTPEQVASSKPTDFFGSPDDKLAIEQAIERVLRNGSNIVETDLCTRSGRRIPYLFTGVRIELEGRWCVSGMGIDLTDRRRDEESLRLRDRALQASVNAIVIAALDGSIEYANPAFERITGFSVEESLGRNCRFLQGEDTEQPGLTTIRNAVRQRREVSALLRNYRKDGSLFWNDLHIAPVRDPAGNVTHFVGVLNDVTNLKYYEEQLQRHATTDTLTALANRHTLKARIGEAITAAQSRQTMVTVGFMDLDNFKFINDSLGHTVGDELLKGVAARLLTCVREHDLIARYGGDEFAFVLVGHRDEKGVCGLVDRILKTVDRPFEVKGHKLYVSCSIGLSSYPKDGDDADTLLRNADAAMYRAKELGRNNFQFYTPAMNQRVTERLSLEARMRQALANGEFMLHYQPKVDLRTGAVVGSEALLRWFRPEGPVPPAAFIPLAEETGLIVPIGEWVLHTACSHSRILRDAGLPLRVAVNISARQFAERTLTQTVRRALNGAGLEPDLLELELTETLVMQNPEDVVRLLHEMKDMGLRLAIDDFGTGYSSLSYLQRLPVDRLKIDQSFVRDIGADPNDAIIARAVISLGHSLGMSVIAEGVSSREQLSFLQQNGCDEMQGYLFSRPVPIEELRLLLQENRSLDLH
ncbi:EAL domain-containing protein [Oxalobacteraceae bacterium OM1]|nr:EAL domain-containing protein [Oxalobacteraceae bacterium OM1]